MSKISSKELFVFTFFLGVILFPGFGNTLVLETGRHAALFSSFVGFLIGFTLLIVLLGAIKTYGMPYLYPLLPFNFKQFMKILFRPTVN